MISDGTGITAENLGNSLMSQFEAIQFEKYILPYIDTVEKARAVVKQINQSFAETEQKPLLFMTLVNTEIANTIKESQGSCYDLFNAFLGPLEAELSAKSSYTVGRTHGVADTELYRHRIEAIDFSLTHDDGLKLQGYSKADIILVGVSRSGKTPTCLYMALHFGILAANYPFTEDDLINDQLPAVLQPFKNKLFGLTINPERLQNIRFGRRPNSTYSSFEQCTREVLEVESMYKKEKIPFLNSTDYSIEEIATKILSISETKRRF